MKNKMKNSMKTGILVLVTLVTPQLTMAAITSNFDCTDASGATIQWEVQPVFGNETGEVIQENLYHNRVSVGVENDNVRFTPDDVVLGKVGQGKIHATSKDGQFLTASALKKIGEEDGGEVVIYSGTAQFKLKTSSGKTIKRAKGTKIICRNYGQA